MLVYLSRVFVNNSVSKVIHAKLFLKMEFMHLYRHAHRHKMLNALTILKIKGVKLFKIKLI